MTEYPTPVLFLLRLRIDNEIRKQISYTSEQKLAAISYAMTTWKSQKGRLIEAYQQILRRSETRHHDQNVKKLDQ